MRRSPEHNAVLLIDAASYIKDTGLNVVYGHRTFRRHFAELNTVGDLSMNLTKIVSENHNLAGASEEEVEAADGTAPMVSESHLAASGGTDVASEVFSNGTHASAEGDYVIHPELGAFQYLAPTLLSLTEVDSKSPGRGALCKAFDFRVPCPAAPDRVLLAMLLESGRERMCFALPVRERLERWTEADWMVFLRYQEGLKTENVLHMAPFLRAYCAEELETFAPDPFLRRLREIWGA